MIALIFLLTLCIYVNMAQELSTDDSLDYEQTSPEQVMGVEFLNHSIAPLLKDNFLRLSFDFEDCRNIGLSNIKEPLYFLFYQKMCGKLTNVHLAFSEETYFFEFLYQLQRLMPLE